MQYELHPLCELFNKPQKDDFDSLVESIKQVGLLDPIKLFERKILDGRSRYAACLAADIEPRFQEVEPEDPIAYVAALNLSRRHLTASEKAMHGARIAAAYEDDAIKRESNGGLASREAKGRAAEKAAKLVDVSRASVNRAQAVIRDGATELVKAVDEKIVTVGDASKIISLPKEVQAAAVAKVKAGEAKTVAVAASTEQTKADYGVDGLGRDIDQHNSSAFGELAKFREYRNLLRKAKDVANDISTGPVGEWINLQAAVIDLENAKRTIMHMAPYTACPLCKGDGCDACRSTGVLPKAAYEALPKGQQWRIGK